MDHIKQIIAEVSARLGFPLAPEEILHLDHENSDRESVFQVEYRVATMPATQLDFIRNAMKKIDLGEDSFIDGAELFPSEDWNWCVGLTVETDHNLTSLQIPDQLRKVFRAGKIKVDEFHMYFTYIATFNKPTFTLRISREHLEDISLPEIRKYLRYKITIGLKEFMKTPLIPLEYSII